MDRRDTILTGVVTAVILAGGGLLWLHGTTIQFAIFVIGIVVLFCFLYRKELAKIGKSPKQVEESEQADQATPPPIMDEETKLRWKLSALWEDEPSEDVQEKAVEIVKLANDESANGRVEYLPHQNGFTVRIGQFTHKGKSGYEQQIWREGIALLVGGGYLDERSEHLFVLTSKGYIKALTAD